MAWRFDAAPLIRLGRRWDIEKGRARELVTFDLSSHVELLAPTRSGKGVCLEIPNLLLELRGASVLSIDPSGQNAAVCAEQRRKVGNDVLCLNPYGLHINRYPDLESCGFNPLAGIDPRHPFFLQDCQAVGEALIKIEGNDTHWTQSARGLVTGIIMWQVLTAFRERRAPLLAEVRRMLCEPEAEDDDGIPTAGLRFHAQQMIADGHWQIGDLAGRFIKEFSREIESIASTARTQTEWLLSEPMRDDLCKNGIGDWGRLADKPTTVFVIVPAHFLETQEGSIWLRLVIMAALRALYARAGRRKVENIVLMLSEFAQLGKLAAVEAARGQGAKYGVKLWPVLQDIHQLRDLYGPHGHESFAGQCGAVFGFAPGDWESAEWMSRRSGEEDAEIRSVSQSESGVSVTRHLQRQRCWPPEYILGLAKNHGLVWFHGQAKAVPVVCTPWYEDRECLATAWRPDPYHSGDGGDGDAARLADWGAAPVALPAGLPLLPEFPPRLALPGPAAASKRRFAKLLGYAAALVVAAGVMAAWALAPNPPARVDPPKAHPTAQHHPAKHVTR